MDTIDPRQAAHDFLIKTVQESGLVLDADDREYLRIKSKLTAKRYPIREEMFENLLSISHRFVESKKNGNPPRITPPRAATPVQPQ